MTNTINVPHINKCMCPTCRPGEVPSPVILGTEFDNDVFHHDLLGIYMDRYSTWRIVIYTFVKDTRESRMSDVYRLADWNGLFIEDNDND